MAQPATALLEPDPDEPGACPAGLAWCVGECPDFNGHYHGSDFAVAAITGSYFRGTDLSVSVHRQDTADEVGAVLISVLTGTDDIVLTAQQARQHAAHLLNAADLADPLPLGETVTTAGLVRLGDDLLTGDGWQTVRGLLLFTDSDQAAAYTDERDDETGDGWEFQLDDVVTVRRRGGVFLEFVEPPR
jgi:hypothetical protein